MFRIAIIPLTLIGWLAFAAPLRADDAPAPLQREFRGVWVATVANIDWPSQAGPARRAAEEGTDRHPRQVRSSCTSTPSSSRSGRWRRAVRVEAGAVVGVPDRHAGQVARVTIRWRSPSREAHARGLELHAWFNPYRAAQPIGEVAARRRTTSPRRRPGPRQAVRQAPLAEPDAPGGAATTRSPSSSTS